MPGQDRAAVTWESAGSGFEEALFVSTDRATLFAGPAIELIGSTSPLVLGGLTAGREHFLGFGLRRAGESDFVALGSVLTVRPGRPIYVDASADPAVADGLTPATAYPDPVFALLDAVVLGGANVHVRAGTYEVANLPVFGGVHVFGGFDASFDLESRDPAGTPSVWRTALGGLGLGLQGPGAPIVLDGLVLEGAGRGSIGVDIVEVGAELRSVEVSGFLDRGLRFRNGTGDDLDLLLVECQLFDNGADGASLSGSVDVRLESSTFLRNGQEGVELDALIALSGDTSRLVVRSCTFGGNGSEGLDADLDAPAGAPQPPGAFLVRVEGSRFEENGLDGLLLDLDFEAAPGWSADLLVRDSTARGNRASGFHVDADASSRVLLQRVVSTANRGDGVWISSESQPGLALVSTAVLAANLGAGLRSTQGNVTPLLLHAAVAGNQGGGLVCESVPGVASSTVFWRQPRALVGAERVGSPVLDDLSSPAFANVGEQFLRVDGLQGDVLLVQGTSELVPSADLELGDDGVERRIAGFVPGGLRLEEAPPAGPYPMPLVAFAPGAGVEEDWSLPSGSLARGTGLGLPGGAPTDPGPAGAPHPGTGPEADLEDLLRLVAATPWPALGVASSEVIELRFSAPLDPSSIGPGVVRAVAPDRSELGATVLVEQEGIRVLPPPGGWGASAVGIELHREVRSLDGDTLATPALLVFPRR